MVLEIQQSNEFDQKNFRGFNHRNLKGTLVVVKSRSFSIERINEVEGYNKRNRLNNEVSFNVLKKDIFCKEGQESVHTIFDYFMLLSTVYSFHISNGLYR